MGKKSSWGKTTIRQTCRRPSFQVEWRSVKGCWKEMHAPSQGHGKLVHTRGGLCQQWTATCWWYNHFNFLKLEKSLYYEYQSSYHFGNTSQLTLSGFTSSSSWSHQPVHVHCWTSPKDFRFSRSETTRIHRLLDALVTCSINNPLCLNLSD